MTTPLETLLLRQIATDGPLSVAAYMTACLLHPSHGYYTTRDPLGAEGDFVTAPEVSQMFGELIGLCLAQAWVDRGRPAPFALAELGPGRGTLMADLLRATAGVPGFHDAMELHLVEASPRMRAAQIRKLPQMAPCWHDSVADLPDLPLFLVANEFFDALPVRQFLRDGDTWRERVVGAESGRLAFGLTDPTAAPDLAGRPEPVPDGGLLETCAPAAALAQHIGAGIADRGGVALIVDYGSTWSLGDTLQALHAHKKVSPLHRPGECDVTAHVAFWPLARAASPARATDPVPQGVFLERLGITARARALAARDPEGVAAAHRRLTHPEEMGLLFKAQALYADDGPVPPGFMP